jgi:hypothetical protein
MKQYTLRKHINNTNESIATIEQIIVITSLAILMTSQLLKLFYFIFQGLLTPIISYTKLGKLNSYSPSYEIDFSKICDTSHCIPIMQTPLC